MYKTYNLFSKKEEKKLNGKQTFYDHSQNRSSQMCIKI